MGLLENDYSQGFQSRMGRTPWIKPYTDELLVSLAASGVKRLLVSCPSFVTDCLETLEEIGIRGKADFIAAGGEDLLLAPCLNDDDAWVETVADMIRGI
jgi:ferrochelatase